MLNPALLLFLPLVLLPVVLHLITLRRLRTVELSTFRFLMDSYVQQRRRIRLLEYLVMLLRVAFVALVVAALARPVISEYGWLFTGGSGRDVTIIIDTSATMSLETAGTTCLSRARASVGRVIRMLQPDDYVTLVAAGAEPRVLARGYAGSPQYLLDQLDAVTTHWQSADLAAAVEQTLAARPRGPRVMYLFTHAHAQSFAGFAARDVRRLLDDPDQLVIMDVGPTQPVENLAVVGDAMPFQRAVAGLPLTLRATVINSSPDAVETMVSLYLEDERVRQWPVRVAAESQEVISTTITPRVVDGPGAGSSAGLIRGRFELPADAFAQDNTWLFCLNVDAGLHVLIVTQQPAARGADDPALFLRTALASPLYAEAHAHRQDQQIAAVLNVRHIDVSELDTEQLQHADVVLLADVAMNGQRGDLLRTFVQRGGGLLIFPGDNIQPEAYEQHLLQTAATESAIPEDAEPSTASLLYRTPRGDPDDPATFATISGFDRTHPVLHVFDQEDKGYFAKVRLYRHWPIAGTMQAGRTAEPSAELPRERAVALMHLPDGDALLAEMTMGRGKVMLAGFGATPRWSNLPLMSEFVPLLLRAVVDLRGPSPVFLDPPSSARPAAVLHLPLPWAEADVKVTDPLGRSQPVTMHRSGEQLVGRVRDAAQPGYTIVDITPDPTTITRDTLATRLGMATNIDPAQSVFHWLDEADLRELFAPHDMTYLQGSADDTLLAEQLTRQREIWRYLIWAMFAIMAVEFIMATLRPLPGADQRQPQPGPAAAFRRWMGATGLLESVKADKS